MRSKHVIRKSKIQAGLKPRTLREWVIQAGWKPRTLRGAGWKSRTLRGAGWKPRTLRGVGFHFGPRFLHISYLYSLRDLTHC